MLARILTSMRLAPRLWSAWLIGATCTLLTLTSFCGEVRLAERDGFAEAVATLTAEPPDFTIVWPPHAADALGALPTQLRAADAVPSERPDQRRYLSLAVIGPAGFDEPPELAEATPSPRRRFGEVEVGRYAYPVADRVLFDLRRSLARSSVSLRGPEAEIACDQRRRDGGWDCPGRPPWNHVAPTQLRVEGRDWDCVWAHPVSEHDLIIDLGRQPLGDRIRVEAALSDDAATTPGGARVVIRLEVRPDSGAELTQVLQRSNQAGRETLEMPTSGLGNGEVRLVVRTTRDARRHLGLGLWIVDQARARTRGGAQP